MPENNQTVNIMGTTYTIVYCDYNSFPEFKLKGACGFCDSMLKIITVCNVKSHPEFNDVTDEYANNLTKEIIRHEVFHAFLYESGLAEDSQMPDSGWAVNEEMVDWLAIQSPKIYKVFNKLGVL